MNDRPLVLDTMRASLVRGIGHRRRHTHRVLAGVALACVVLLAGAIAVLATRGDDSRGVVTEPRPSSTTAAPTTAPATTAPVPAITGTSPTGPVPYHLTVGAASVWVVDSSDQTLRRYDPSTGSLLDSIRIAPPGTTTGVRVAVGDGRVRVGGGLGFRSVGIDGDDVRTYSLPRGDSDTPRRTVAIGYGHGSVWVQTADLHRVDPATGAEVARIELPGAATPMDVAIGPDAVWVLASRQGANRLVRIDPTTNEITHRLDLPDFAVRLVADERGVVVGTAEKPAGYTYGTVYVINPAAATALTETRVPSRPEGIALTADYIWVGGTSLSVLDRVTLAPVATVDEVAFSLAFGEGAIWAAQPAVDRLARIDPGPYG